MHHSNAVPHLCIRGFIFTKYASHSSFKTTSFDNLASWTIGCLQNMHPIFFPNVFGNITHSLCSFTRPLKINTSISCTKNLRKNSTPVKYCTTSQLATLYHGLPLFLSRARRLKTNRCNTLLSTPCLTRRMGSSYSITNDTDKDIWVWDGVNVDAIIWGTGGAFMGVGASKYSTTKPYLTFL